MNKGHCSALIKILPGYENVYAAHSRSVSHMKEMCENFLAHIKKQFNSLNCTCARTQLVHLYRNEQNIQALHI